MQVVLNTFSFSGLGTQTVVPSTKSVSVQCDLLNAPPLTRLGGTDLEQLEDEEEMQSEETTDPDYLPSVEELQQYEEERESEPVCRPSAVFPFHSEAKYMVFESCLLQLLTWCHCPKCGSHDLGERLPQLCVTGSQLTLTVR